jgi:hypothetical protein
MTEQISIPYKFIPRPYQVSILKAIDDGYKRIVFTATRRAGKDKIMWNAAIKLAFSRVGTVYYMLPLLNQAKRVIWQGIDNDGFRFLDHIPTELTSSINKTDMKIDLINGSSIQLMGADDYEKLRGSNPIAVIFSEYAFSDPAAWDVVRPILTVNGGVAMFNSTTNGKNHYYDLTQMADKNDQWFNLVVPADEALDSEGNRYITDEMIQDERD